MCAVCIPPMSDSSMRWILATSHFDDWFVTRYCLRHCLEFWGEVFLSFLLLLCWLFLRRGSSGKVVDPRSPGGRYSSLQSATYTYLRGTLRDPHTFKPEGGQLDNLFSLFFFRFFSPISIHTSVSKTSTADYLASTRTGDARIRENDMQQDHVPNPSIHAGYGM
ncbi:hypothetical protein B0T19DRAFT_274731 [Cercophora scortea]|uniref:Uncharacterized protein n=1 Tax=Cercophora scortea TaxID=314031 RepID=A0AAE0M6P8_9PEZI|nr:hypothetical protein B0T19DRAFT_274731 [Cercophora scortea]